MDKGGLQWPLYFERPENAVGLDHIPTRNIRRALRRTGIAFRVARRKGRFLFVSVLGPVSQASQFISEFTIHDAAQEDAAQGPETSAVSASSPNAAQEVTNRDEALTLAPK